MNCTNCNDTGRDPGSDYLDCAAPGCTAAAERAALEKFVASMGRGALQMDTDTVVWAIHQRARAIERQAAATSAERIMAWASDDGRVQPQSAMETARRVGGATAMAMAPYTLALVPASTRQLARDDSAARVAELEAESVADVIETLMGELVLDWRPQGDADAFGSKAHERAELLHQVRKAMSAAPLPPAAAPAMPGEWLSKVCGPEVDGLSYWQGYRRGFNDCRAAVLKVAAPAPESQPADEAAERALFEATAIAEQQDFDLTHHPLYKELYVDDETDSAWWAWRARAAISAPMPAAQDGWKRNEGWQPVADDVLVSIIYEGGATDTDVAGHYVWEIAGDDVLDVAYYFILPAAPVSTEAQSHE